MATAFEEVGTETGGTLRLGGTGKIRVHASSRQQSGYTKKTHPVFEVLTINKMPESLDRLKTRGNSTTDCEVIQLSKGSSTTSVLTNTLAKVMLKLMISTATTSFTSRIFAVSESESDAYKLAAEFTRILQDKSFESTNELDIAIKNLPDKKLYILLSVMSDMGFSLSKELASSIFEKALRSKSPEVVASAIQSLNEGGEFGVDFYFKLKSVATSDSLAKKFIAFCD